MHSTATIGVDGMSRQGRSYNDINGDMCILVLLCISMPLWWRLVQPIGSVLYGTKQRQLTSLWPDTFICMDVYFLRECQQQTAFEHTM